VGSNPTIFFVIVMLYEVVLQGILKDEEEGTYDDEFEYDEYIEYEGTEDELAGDIIFALKEQGYELVRTNKMKAEDIDRIRIGIRSEGLNGQRSKK